MTKDTAIALFGMLCVYIALLTDDRITRAGLLAMAFAIALIILNPKRKDPQ